MDLLGRSKLPQVELNEDDLNALSGLGKVDSKTGLSYNPYKDINPEFLKLTEDDDDDWLYMSVRKNMYLKTDPSCICLRFYSHNLALIFENFFRKNKNPVSVTVTFLTWSGQRV